MSDRLFFGYARSKSRHYSKIDSLDVIETVFGGDRSILTTACDSCGATLVAGDWPFCSGHRSQIQPGVPGNVTPIGDNAVTSDGSDASSVVAGLNLV